MDTPFTDLSELADDRSIGDISMFDVDGYLRLREFTEDLLTDRVLVLDIDEDFRTGSNLPEEDSSSLSFLWSGDILSEATMEPYHVVVRPTTVRITMILLGEIVIRNIHPPDDCDTLRSMLIEEKNFRVVILLEVLEEEDRTRSDEGEGDIVNLLEKFDPIGTREDISPDLAKGDPLLEIVHSRTKCILLDDDTDRRIPHYLLTQGIEDHPARCIISPHICTDTDRRVSFTNT